MINIYNPFKPHIVRFNNGKFGIRKYELFRGWTYYDQTNKFHYYWGDEENMPKYCQADSIEVLQKPLTSQYYKE